MGPPNQGTENLMVSDLVVPNTGQWNIQEINKLLPDYKEIITNLRPSALGAPDRLVWLGETSGVYTSKSGYHKAREEATHLHNQAHINSFNWKQHIWSIKAPHKIKLFLWKAIRGALPVGAQLATRGIQSHINCMRCDQPETIEHLLFHCPYAQKVWDLAPFKETISSGSISTLQEGLAHSHQMITLPPTGISNGPLFPWISWTLWLARNQLVFQNRTFTARETITKATHDAYEWTLAQLKHGNPIRHTNNQPINPLASGLCCFSDGAWKEEQRIAGLGWIIRERDGRIIAKGARSEERDGNRLSFDG